MKNSFILSVWFHKSSLSLRILSKETSSSILLDPLDFKLVMAKHYLEKIDSSVSLDFDWNHFKLESSSESFLSYADMAIEILANDINKEFQLLSLNEDISIYKMRKKLLIGSDLRERVILEILNDYFLYPSRSDSEWDLSKSSLWEIRELRNHVAHNPIINRINYRGGGPDAADYLFRFSFLEIDEASGTKRQIKIELPVSNPLQHFRTLFNDLLRFVERTRKIIPYSHSSYQHRNRLNFEL